MHLLKSIRRLHVKRATAGLIAVLACLLAGGVAA